ncbi:site-2 protease family protein [Microvirga sp. 2MCAF38]|uniref:site-2 protease family protein n=1 Tax=Microvirga sp. 2MCAF38 TaxID=3232989 RepID=UPI003F9C13B1
MFDPDPILAYVLGTAALGYVLFVNRRLQLYKRRFVLDIPIEAAWELLSATPGRGKEWIPGLISIEWSNENANEIVSRFENGQGFSRLTLRIPPTREEGVTVFRWNEGSGPSDIIHTRLELRAVPEGTEVDLAYIIERSHLARGLLRRLGYPMLTGRVSRLVRAHLAKERLDSGAPQSTTNQSAPSPRRNLMTQLCLTVLSLAAMTYSLGVDMGLAVLATIIVHEYGHVWALRRHGHQAHFYLIPFLGGVAVGSRAYVSDAEAAEVILMGPAFGLLPPLACLGIFAAMSDDRWLGAGFVALAVNLFNLLPVPPLDGGRLVQTLLKPLGDKIWFAASGCLILAGAALALHLRSQTFLVITVVTAILWSASPKRPQAERPLSFMGGGMAASAYLGLTAFHVAAVLWCDQILDGRLLRAFGIW